MSQKETNVKQRIKCVAQTNYVSARDLNSVRTLLATVKKQVGEIAYLGQISFKHLCLLQSLAVNALNYSSIE